MSDEDDGWQGVSAAIARFGVPAEHTDRPAIVAALDEQIRLETDNGGTHCAIDVAFLCGAGLVETQAFLAAAGTNEAAAALKYIRECEACGNFADFNVAGEVANLRRQYGIESE